MKQNTKIIGYILFAFAIVCWILTPIIPFLDWDNTIKGVAISSVFVAGEAAFIVALTLLGKEFWIKIKQGFKHFFTRKEHE